MSLNNKEQIDLINDLGLNKSAVSTWCNGTRLPRMDKVQLLANYFGIEKSDLIEDRPTKTNVNNIYQIELKRFPLLGEIACGRPKYTNEDRESYVMAGTDIKADFCLRAAGDSMIGARINDGDIVFIRKQNIVENGEIAAVVLKNDSKATLKRLYYYKEKGLLILKAENPAYEDMVFIGEELNNIHILGKAIAFQSDVK